MTRTKRAAIYCRVSRDEQAENWSLPTQEEACRKYAEAHGYEIVEVFLEDFTGTVIDRPELNRVMRLVAAGQIDVVLAYKIDRLSRGGPNHVGYLLTVFQMHGVSCETVIEPIEDTPDGQLMTAFRAGSANREVKDIRERTTRGMRAKVKSGKPIGRSRPPFGLRYKSPILDSENNPIKGTVKAAYEEHPDTIDTLRWLFAEADAGASLRSLTKQLEQMGVRPPQFDRTGSTKWVPASVKLILSNRNYIGEGIQFLDRTERHPDPKFKEKRTRREIDPDGDGAIPLPPGVYPVVIDPALFERVQRRLAQNKRESQRKDRDPEFGLLRRGIARCGCCNSSLGFAYRSGRDASGKAARYECQGGQRERHGHGPVEMSVPKLDGQVWAWVKELRNDPRLVERFAERVQRGKDATDEAAAALAVLDGRIADLDGQRAKLAKRLAMVDDDNAPLIVEELRRLGEQRKALAMQRENLSEKAKAETRRRQRIERSVEIASGIAEAGTDLDGLSYHEKRRILMDLGVSVFLYPNGHAPRWGMRLGFDNPQSRIRVVGNEASGLFVWDELGDFDEATFYAPDLSSTPWSGVSGAPTSGSGAARRALG